MKKIITITGIAAVLALSGCAVPVDDVETGSQAAPAPAAPPVEQDAYEDVVAVPEGDEYGYVAALDEYAPEWRAYGSESDVVKVGWTTCSVFDDMGVDAGMDVVIASALTSGLPGEIVGATTAASVLFLCPVHEADVREWMQSADAGTAFDA
jgi:hypothetical protein